MEPGDFGVPSQVAQWYELLQCRGDRSSWVRRLPGGGIAITIQYCLENSYRIGSLVAAIQSAKSDTTERALASADQPLGNGQGGPGLGWSSWLLGVMMQAWGAGAGPAPHGLRTGWGDPVTCLPMSSKKGRTWTG